jgi:hypothetical protein
MRTERARYPARVLTDLGHVRRVLSNLCEFIFTHKCIFIYIYTNYHIKHVHAYSHTHTHTIPDRHASQMKCSRCFDSQNSPFSHAVTSSHTQQEAVPQKNASASRSSAVHLYVQWVKECISTTHEPTYFTKLHYTAPHHTTYAPHLPFGAQEVAQHVSHALVDTLARFHVCRGCQSPPDQQLAHHYPECIHV